MRQNHQQPEAIQLELLKKTSKGWESTLPTVESYNFTTDQIEHHFGILRKDLYKIRSKPYFCGSSTLLFLHIQKNKWQVYNLKPLQVDESGKTIF
ncbi:hypothetical protein H6G06_10760 [Anabaena sphaerica FACHB-251]|uniref:Uncharacterized protein n=1 Tax=Anabaena sphaerica FACHB-251 TaxID=2692883 RepID=A0A927A1X9_9NOST|nr:hypothetical protein [Anabaena sphaerica]MBD2293960.1 hypothetical protein [Anabaena sphaerica FACHB-251]